MMYYSFRLKLPRDCVQQIRIDFIAERHQLGAFGDQIAASLLNTRFYVIDVALFVPFSKFLLSPSRLSTLPV